MKKTNRAICSIIACTLAVTVWTLPRNAEAFCGFYVGGAGADLYNNATQVVLMREGTRTVLSMQNSYQGPTKDFAMVVPVPTVLKKEDVKTLSADVFKHIDRLSAPRLVEYWEKDPCAPPVDYRTKSVQESSAPDPTAKPDSGVKILAQFAVGEYNIVMLSAENSTGLEKWLTDAKYNIPKGAAKYLKPYVQGGSKFFVAKVDASKVKFKDGKAVLSPLRVAYDSKEFTLPIRLGMMNANGAQDLIVHILAQGQRYNVSNYKNVTIPTNLAVVNAVRKRFGEFYAALFDATIAQNPGAVVTEYAWAASSCDPCPSPTLTNQEILTLGGDVLASKAASGFVLTRLHARYEKDGVKDDLVFAKAPPILGGRQVTAPGSKTLEQGSIKGRVNNFQGRYIIRHKWSGPVKCAKPIYGNWGSGRGGRGQPMPATNLADAPRGKIQLASMVAQNVPEIAIKTAASPAAKATSTGVSKADKKGSKGKKKGCGCSVGGSPASSAGTLVLLLGCALLIARRRQCTTH